MKRARREDAERELQAVLSQDKKNVDALYYLGITHADSGDLDKAQENFEKAVSINQKHVLPTTSSARLWP
jgi:Tfp pilus assembly protein PilF